MSTPKEASRILASEAKTIFGPLGLKQRGRSRIWLDDHAWWIGVVEFQPSSWSQGAYLNVGCCLLWNTKNYISYDLGGRVERHVKFEDSEQFRPHAKQLALLAGQEIELWRKTIADVSSLSTYYNSLKLPKNLWPQFHAAIAAGLSGDASRANEYFSQIEPPSDGDYAWQVKAKMRAAELQKLLPDLEAFRTEIAVGVQQCRALLKLPPLTDLNFDALQTQ